MSTFTLTIGLVIRDGQRTWRLDRTLDDSRNVFLDLESGAPKTISTAELQRDLLAGRLLVVQEHPVALSKQAESATQLVQTVEDLPEKEQRRLKYRMGIVKHMLRRGIRKGMRSLIRIELAKLPAQTVSELAEAETTSAAQVPTASTVMDWMRKFDRSGGNPLSLLSGNCFRRASGRLHPLVLEIARRKVRDHYCTRKRPSASATKLVIDRELSVQADRGRIDAAEAAISISTLRRVIHEVSPFERCVARYGPAYARNKWRYSLGGIDAPRALARYEIDHTILDIVVVHDVTGMPMGRPTITVVVDGYSGYIAGFFISFWSASLASALSAFKIAISPKYFLTEHAELRHRWLAFGIPDLIVVDNGLEFHSRHFHAAAWHLATDVLHCAVRQPWLKPTVERTIGEINGYLPAAGRVEKPLNNYLPEQPEKHACITFGALCMGVLKAVVDVHPFEVSERRLDRAYDLYGEGLATQLAPRLASSFNELDIIMASAKTLTVGNEGVVKDYLRYNSPELQALRRRVGLTFRTEVKFNPENLHHVWVHDPLQKSWLHVPSCQAEYTEGLSAVQHRAIRASKKKELTLRNAAETLTRGRLELIDMWGGAIRSGKRVKSNFLKAAEGFTSTSTLGAASRKPESADAATPLIPVTKAELMALPNEMETYAFE
ncbi:transposase family protein [Pelomonas cellulosilytica]|uniref:Transposase family protein n=1 Tax=Pelomonas cellulosilytica TaxID=2906762 RepID=A0ABS8XWI3_9BURK|nr:transposase family protein [Pelomonas sp. P8]MCE4555588.1 transposase family protein [Pelomonas sp. P8]